MILAHSLVIGCSLMHIVCCGIPLLTTIVGLGATVGILSNGVLENSLIANYEKFEIEVLILSGIVLASAYALKYRAKKLECCEGESKQICEKSEKINSLFLKASSALYLLSLVILAANEISLSHA